MRVALPALLLLTGCMTPYGPMTWRGGYLDWKLGAARHHVEVRGLRLDELQLRQWFHRRAMELCTAEGFTGYSGEAQTSTPVLSRQSDGPVVYGDVTCTKE